MFIELISITSWPAAFAVVGVAIAGAAAIVGFMWCWYKLWTT